MYSIQSISTADQSIEDAVKLDRYQLDCSQLKSCDYGKTPWPDSPSHIHATACQTGLSECTMQYGMPKASNRDVSRCLTELVELSA